MIVSKKKKVKKKLQRNLVSGKSSILIRIILSPRLIDPFTPPYKVWKKEKGFGCELCLHSPHIPPASL